MCKCKYAGDPEDEYCKSCNGLTMMIDGKECSCEDCAGYEAGEEESKEEFSMPEPVVEEEEPVKEEPKKKANKPAKKAEDTNNKTKPEKAVPTQVPKEIKVDSTSVGSVTLLRYMSGATICHNDTYYKFECCEERKLPEDLTEDQVQDEREKLWAHLNAEVDKQIADVING